MFYTGWQASVDGIVCHRCAENQNQSGQPSSRSLSDVFGENPDGEGEYLELEARKDHRCCPHSSQIQDDTNWSSLDSHSWQSSCPECDPGPKSPKNRVRRGHALVAVVTGQIRSGETAVATETTDEFVGRDLKVIR